MKTSVTKRGQTVVPASLRRRYDIDEKTVLQWIDTGETIKVVPIPKDVTTSLRGIARGEKLLDTLLAERRADAGRE